MSTTDDIKSKLDIVEYLREQGVQLIAAGQSFKARCPFHNEKTASFMVNAQKQVWHCFGCSKGGDLFTFVQEREGMEFAEALKLLADRAGVALEARDPRLEGQKTRVLAVLDASAAFFQQQFAASVRTQEYVVQRRMPAAMVEQFQIGYAPDAWDALAKNLLGRGYTAQELVEAGVAIARATQHAQHATYEHESGHLASSVQHPTHCYDRFRHRLMFPIHDANARIVGFTARMLDGGTTVGPEPAKYVNTPETAVYKKGGILYGLVFAKQALRTQGFAVLVEGQMDVIASHGVGITQTIAASGTALTEQQLHLLKRYTARLHVAFDADPAGEHAAARGIDAALAAGFDVRVIRSPRGVDGAPIGKDADECIQRDADAWRAAVVHAVPVLDYFLERVRERFDCTSPAGKRDAGHVLVQHLRFVADPIERAAWMQRSADAIGVPERALREAVLTIAHPRAKDRGEHVPRALEPSAPPRHVVDPRERLGNRLLSLLVRFPTSVGSLFEAFSVDNFSTEPQCELYKLLKLRYTTQEASRNEIAEGTPTLSAYVQRLELFADREFSDLQQRAVEEEISRCAQQLRRHVILAALHVIAQSLKEIEQQESAQRLDGAVGNLEQQFHKLTNELSSLHG